MSKIKTTYIYALIDPRNGHIKYIGKANVPSQRFKGHLIKAKSGYNLHVCVWIRGILKMGELPILEIIDEVPISEWEFWEIHYISLFKSWGYKLTNMSDGGEMPKSTPEQIEKKAALLRKPVLQYDLDGNFIREWISMTEAGKRMNFTASIGKEKTAFIHGYQWRHKTKSYPLKIDKYINEKIQSYACYDYKNGKLLVVYTNIHEAVKETGVPEKTIYNSVYTNAVCKFKYVFKQIGPKDTPEQEIIISQKPSRKNILQYSRDGVFISEWISISEAAKNNNIGVSVISSVLTGVRPTAKNCIWKYKTSDNYPLQIEAVPEREQLPSVILGHKKVAEKLIGKKLSEETRKKIGKSKAGQPSIRRKPILQFDLDGNFIKEWECASMAGKLSGICATQIFKCLKNKLESTKGFIFKYKLEKDAA